MSYCRWSDLDGYCDVYVYEDVSGGWTTHVAKTRRRPGAPASGMELLLAGGDEEGHPAAEIYQAQRAARDAWDEENPPLPIDHPDASASFNDPTPGDCAARLESLRAGGLLVPFHVIPELREEQRELDREARGPDPE